MCQIRPAQSPLTKQIEACADSLPGWNSLIVTLMLEFCRLPTSPWAPYLRTLPDTFTTPLYWSPEERSELEGTAVLSGLGEDEIKHDFAEGVLPFLKAHQHPWFEALQLPTPGEVSHSDKLRACSLCCLSPLLYFPALSVGLCPSGRTPRARRGACLLALPTLR